MTLANKSLEMNENSSSTETSKSRESWTLNEKHKHTAIFKAKVIRLLKQINNKTKMSYLRWFGLLSRMSDDRLTERVYKT